MVDPAQVPGERDAINMPSKHEKITPKAVERTAASQESRAFTPTAIAMSKSDLLKTSTNDEADPTDSAVADAKPHPMTRKRSGIANSQAQSISPARPGLRFTSAEDGSSHSPKSGKASRTSAKTSLGVVALTPVEKSVTKAPTGRKHLINAKDQTIDAWTAQNDTSTKITTANRSRKLRVRDELGRAIIPAPSSESFGKVSKNKVAKPGSYESRPRAELPKKGMRELRGLWVDEWRKAKQQGFDDSLDEFIAERLWEVRSGRNYTGFVASEANL